MIRVLKNPKDQKLLDNIEIKKYVYPDIIVYYAYHNKKIIAHLVLNKNYNHINTITINDKFKRKGLATYLYDYIENTENIKLKPSSFLLKDGKAFWENRLKQKNPTDLQFLNRIRIEKVDLLAGIRYYVWLDDLCIGVFVIQKRNNFVEEMEIWDSKYKHRGLATYMFDYIEKDLNIKLVPSKYQTKAGRAFWKNRLKNA